MSSDPVMEWQEKNLPILRTLKFGPPCSRDVTLITNWLWSDERFNTYLDQLLAAVLMTWHTCGRLPVVLMVNRVTPTLQRMSDEWGIGLSVLPHLRGGGGNVRDINRDSILNLADRFETEYALSFQHHAFPLRAGLPAFLGRYDYIGAPWVFGKDDRITRLLLRHRGDVGNGAFTLRTRRLCETISWYYRRKYKLLPHCFLVIDDYFIAKTLPSFERKYRETIRIAPAEVAANFALEDNETLHSAVHANPFGFHGPRAFAQLLREGRVPDLSAGT